MIHTVLRNTIALILLVGLGVPVSAEKTHTKRTYTGSFKFKHPNGGGTRTERPMGPDDIEMSLYTPGKSWIYSFYDPSAPDKPDYSYKLIAECDTVTGWGTVSKIRIEDLNQPSQPPSFTFASQDNAMVYLYFTEGYLIDGMLQNIPIFVPMYNFNLKVGGKINENGQEVTAVYTAEIHGVERRVQKLGSGDRCDGYWIEGIGSTNPFITITEFATEMGRGYVGKLVACYDGEECLYEETDFDLLATAGIHDPTSSDGAETFYYNLQGQQVSDPVKGELYIEHRGTQSRKVLWR